MDKRVVAHSQVLCWLQESVLASHVVNFVGYLRDCRYAAQTLHSYACAVAHFARWLTLQRLQLPQVNDLQGFGHYFNEGKAKEAVNAAFTRVENRLNEIRDSSSDQSVKAISGTSLVHKLFAAGLMDVPYPSLAHGNQKSREAYAENLKVFLASGVGWFRNSFSHEPHNIPDISDWEALELLMVASHMLRMIDLCLAAAAQP